MCLPDLVGAARRMYRLYKILNQQKKGGPHGPPP